MMAPRAFVSADGRVRGWALHFNRPDMVGDVIATQALDATLNKRQPGDVPMLINHAPGVVAGRWLALTPSRKGLFVQGCLHPVMRADDIGRDIASGLLIGLSIGFKTRQARMTRQGRTILDLSLIEISIVPMPLQDRAWLEPWE